MATLKELMGDLTRGDGRKFRKNKWSDCYWFEPIFQEFEGDWFGVDQDNFMQSFCDGDSLDWELYTEPKEKKKVKLYRGIYKNPGIRQIYQFGEWQTDKIVIDYYLKNLVGWQEMEIEVDE